MFKALLIDDEMYVRRRMRSIVDWGKYGIEIAGEAENGRAALTFMRGQPVDIIFTDLEMPGLGGIPFLQAVRSAYPAVRIVVLTMHQEFAFIQKAMRLGVDDYIAKAEIDEDSFGGMLTEILARIRNLPGQQFIAQSHVHCLYCPVAQPLGDGDDPRRLSEHFFLREAEEAVPPGAVAIHVRGLAGENYRQLRDALQTYVERSLFYDYLPDLELYTLDMGALRDGDMRAEEGRLTRALIEQKMTSAAWLLQQDIYREVMALVPTLGMGRETLVAFFFQPFLRCARYLNVPADYYFEQTARLVWWHEWKAWFSQLRDQLADFMAAEDTGAHRIEKALLYIDAHFRENIDQKTILRVAALSKSHFSSLFKEQTGATFVDYVKGLRVEAAKVYLRETGWPMAQVAQQVGYADERYFRRVFIECVGISPSQYRRELTPEG